MHWLCLTFILFGGSFAKLDGSFWRYYEQGLVSQMEDRLPLKKTYAGRFLVKEKDTEQAKFVAQSTAALLELKEFDNYVFDKELGAGTYGFVYRGVGGAELEPITLKIMIAEDAAYSECRDAWKNYQLVAKEQIPYLVETKPPVERHFKATKKGTTDLYMCAIQMDMGAAADKPMFSSSGAADLPKNNDGFIDFCRRMIRTFAYLHDAKIVHADIKPANVLFKHTSNGLEPRLIDFDLTFKMKHAEFNPGWPVYSLPYRPPELKKILPDVNPNSDSEWRKLKAYRYDPLLREEAWAVGRTLKDIFYTNEGFLDLKDERLATLVEIINNMKREEIVDRTYKGKDRWTTNQALEAVMKIPTDHNQVRLRI